MGTEGGGEMSTINVDGAGNNVFVSGGGKSLRVEVDGADNVVIVRSGGTLRIGGQQAQTRPTRPQVKRGQVWQHGVIARRYQVISVRSDTARCLVTDLSGKALRDDSGEALIQDIGTINIRYAYTLVTGGSDV